MAEAFITALRLTYFVIEMSNALGNSKVLCNDIYEEMDGASKLFALFGIRIPSKVTLGQEIVFTKIKPSVQELAVECTNILRFHEDAENLAKYVMSMEISRSLDNTALQRAPFLVEAIRHEFGLDENNMPVKKAKYSNCAMKAFEKSKLRYVFVDDMEEFWMTPIPRRSWASDGGLRGTDSEFRRNIFEHKILLAY